VDSAVPFGQLAFQLFQIPNIATMQKGEPPAKHRESYEGRGNRIVEDPVIVKSATPITGEGVTANRNFRGALV